MERFSREVACSDLHFYKIPQAAIWRVNSHKAYVKVKWNG